MSDDTKVKVVGLTKKFGDLLVLNDISFNVKKGDFVCIVGPTGCGKTTFLNLLVKLIEPTSGQILIDGEPADPKKHNIAFVFQEPSAYPWLTVEENLQYGLKIKKVDQKTIEERTKEIAESLGLTEVLKSYPRELSASLEQRVVIGRSFALHTLQFARIHTQQRNQEQSIMPTFLQWVVGSQAKLWDARSQIHF